MKPRPSDLGSLDYGGAAVGLPKKRGSFYARSWRMSSFNKVKFCKLRYLAGTTGRSMKLAASAPARQLNHSRKLIFRMRPPVPTSHPASGLAKATAQ